MTSPSPRRLPGEPAELVGRSVQAEGGHVGTAKAREEPWEHWSSTTRISR